MKKGTLKVIQNLVSNAKLGLEINLIDLSIDQEDTKVKQIIAGIPMEIQKVKLDFIFKRKICFKVLGATLLILTFGLNIVKFRNVLSFRIYTKTMILTITKTTTGLLMILRITIITKVMAGFLNILLHFWGRLIWSQIILMPIMKHMITTVLILMIIEKVNLKKLII